MADTPLVPRPTPRYQAVLAAASRCAVELGHDYVGTEHLLLALLADRHAVDTQVIEHFAPALEIDNKLRTLMASATYNTRRHPPGIDDAPPGIA